MYLDHSVEYLEQSYWGEAPEASSYLVKTCHTLRRKKIADFTIEDLRILIGQEIGLQYIIPKAIEILKDNPFAEGDFYEGDLLVNVLRCPYDFWQQHPVLIAGLTDIVLIAEKRIIELDTIDSIKNEISKLISEYMQWTHQWKNTCRS